ncbi:MAG: bifunctional adenosylcobinamide kinase/adenosylcobinamide-phosphate guanylyltransferase [Acidobacteriota bacterium]
MILITGGARAGKSAFALRLASEYETHRCGKVCFIATAEALDDEMQARILSHRAERPSHWLTIEETRQLDQALIKASDADIVIVDCLTLFVSNWLMAVSRESASDEVMRVVASFLKLATNTGQTIIFVTNEVGMGLVPETSLGRIFRDILGRVNQRLAQTASQVYLLVAGLPLQLKPTGKSK